ncbi:alpha,alpha-trehalase [Saccharomycopsis crataegensis]|uniref:Trehalase n=1 Tax=Saccharomycopsis crataegensis TaxID=43959 RepID=A0AAV5QPN1_9ASCO|nr:alpha,alpha-trehalase [Saccharomycopsis crataegensis]
MTAKHSRNLSMGSDDMDPFSTPEVYYGAKTDPSKQFRNSKVIRGRTFSGTLPRITPAWNFSADDSIMEKDSSHREFHKSDYPIKRRSSEDDMAYGSRRFLISDIDGTLETLLKNEDTDQNHQITIEDTGPKVLKLGTANSNGYNQYAIRGTYMLSNLLQELTIAKRMGRNQMILDEARLNENPVRRLKRLISTQFWNNLTRRVSEDNIMEMAHDTKIPAEYTRVYVPPNCPDQIEFFRKVEKDAQKKGQKLKIEILPHVITPEYVKSINDKPGLLALAMEEVPVVDDDDSNNASMLFNSKFIDVNEKHKNASKKPKTTLRGLPYVVPGGRFNELYGWDSYMISLGCLIDNRVDLAQGMVEHFIFQINHYGKILNANRSYYLCRSQPPFLTDMAIKVYNKLLENGDNPGAAKEFLERAMVAAIKEYKTVWTCEPRIDVTTGLSCYHPDGLGIPPETESTHFDALLSPYAEKRGVSLTEFQKLYNDQKISEPELDEYFTNDRAVRESGHDTSYRLDGCAASLCTVDLNSLLYKYEVDIAETIRDKFDDHIINELGEGETSAVWLSRAARRKDAMSKYLWNEEHALFYDYNIKTHKQTKYESATAFWPLWSGAATEYQADCLVKKSLSKFEELGGLVAGTEKSRGVISLDRPNRQWDYPYGWAPQQILAWVGLAKYGFGDVARRLVYRWLYIMTKSFVDYNGIVVEKYDVTKPTDPHRVDAEYGNQGADFKGVATEGFGWVNASFELGLEFLSTRAIRALGTITPPDVFFASSKKTQNNPVVHAVEGGIGRPQDQGIVSV